VVYVSWNNEVVFYGCEKCRYVDWSSSIVETTVTKEMSFVSVSRSKVLRLRVVELHRKCGV